MEKKKICVIVATEATVRGFLLDTLKNLSKQYQVTLVVNAPEPSMLTEMLGGMVRVLSLPIERKPSPFRDLLMFCRF